MNKIEKKEKKPDLDIPKSVKCNGFEVRLEQMSKMRHLRRYLAIVRMVEKLATEVA